MNYTLVLLDAFETDLVQKKLAGATDVSFEGSSDQLKLRYNDIERSSVVDGVPSDILHHIVKAIFGEACSGSLTWRGFRMTARTMHSGDKLVDHLTVRLTTTANVEKQIAVEIL